jgi:hypothetical protein
MVRVNAASNVDQNLSRCHLSLAIRLSLNECPLDDIVPGFADMRRDLKAARIQQPARIREHGRTSAHHEAIVLWI